MASFSLNDRAGALADPMVREAAVLGLQVSRGSLGETLVDCSGGGLSAGLHMARVCMSGLASVEAGPSEAFAHWRWHVMVRTSQPVAACLASQYAGWELKHEDGERKFYALGSGPARALAKREPLFQELRHNEASDRAVLVLETNAAPPQAIVEKVLSACGIAADRLTILFAPVWSVAGSVQVVARVVEVALHKAHALSFPIEHIVDAMGSAPFSPPHPDFVTSMGRTNDAIIFGGRVHLLVSGAAEDAERLAQQLPSSSSRDYGAPFKDVFRRFDGDFYAIDPMLFSPAAVAVTALESGKTFRAGAVSPDLLDASFG
jgi:methenyltetrahydromethanopterin cyclohydrolase